MMFNVFLKEWTNYLKCCRLCNHFGMDVQLFIFCKKRQCFEPGVECRGCVKNGLVLPTRVSLCQVVVDGQFDFSWSSSACNGAITDSVGVVSSNMMLVASFIGLSALATSSAFEMFVSLSVQMSPELPHLLTCGEKSAAQIAACCSRNRSIITNALF